MSLVSAPFTVLAVDPAQLEQLGKVGGSILGTAVAVVVVLVPWLRQYVLKPLEALRTPVQETHHQVTVNAHASPEPTVLDRLHTLEGAVEQLGQHIGVMAAIYDAHVDHTGKRDERVDKVLERVEDRLDRLDHPTLPLGLEADPDQEPDL